MERKLPRVWRGAHFHQSSADSLPTKRQDMPFLKCSTRCGLGEEQISAMCLMANFLLQMALNVSPHFKHFKEELSVVCIKHLYGVCEIG